MYRVIRIELYECVIDDDKITFFFYLYEHTRKEQILNSITYYDFLWRRRRR